MGLIRSEPLTPVLLRDMRREARSQDVLRRAVAQRTRLALPHLDRLFAGVTAACFLAPAPCGCRALPRERPI